MQTQVISLDMVPGGIPPVVHISQNDTAARKFYFRILNNGELFDCTGLSAYIQGIKPDGASFSYECSVYQYSIQRSCTEQISAVAGQVIAELKLLDGDGIVGTANFIIDVEPDPLGNATASQSEITEFQALVNAASGYASNSANSASQAASSASAAAQSATSVANALRFSAITTAGTDLDNLTDTGLYYFSTSYAPLNSPITGASGLCLNIALTNSGMSSSSAVKQIWFNQDNGTWKAYTRIKGGNPASWGAWNQYLTANDLTGAISTVLLDNLDTSRVVVTNGYGKLAASGVTTTNLNGLTNLSENVQTAITNLRSGVQSNTSLVQQVMPTMPGIAENLSPASTSVTNDVLTSLGSFTLTKGIWIAFVMVRWTQGGGSSPGRRQVMITDSASAENPVTWSAIITSPATQGGITVQYIPWMVNVSAASQTFYLKGYQNSGVSITAYPQISRARLGAGSIVL